MITTGPPGSTQVVCDQNASESMQSGCEKCPLLTEIHITDECGNSRCEWNQWTLCNGRAQELRSLLVSCKKNAGFSFVQASRRAGSIVMKYELEVRVIQIFQSKNSNAL